MKRVSSVPFFVLLAALVAASPAFAKRVEHHGNTVEANGTADICISCHDGMLAQQVAICTVKCDFTTPHSIMKQYPPHGQRDSYASVSEVNAKGLKIVNGMVTCISCHDLKKQARFHLRVDDRGRLCVICHIKQGGRL